jgi:uncharacterized membrane protein
LAGSTIEESIRSNCFTDREIQMAQNTPRNILTRCLAMFALICIYCVSIVGASTVLLTASSTSAHAQRGRGGGGFRGGGYRGGGFRGGGWRGGGVVRGRGWGRGRGYGFGGVVVGPGCYWSYRWGRRICPYY